MIADNVLLFGRLLRASGLDVHHGRLLDAIRALEWIGVESREDVAATLRSLLVHRQDDIARFDHAFDLFFRTHRTPSPGPPLFSLGERPRVIARPQPGIAIQAELEDVDAGSHALPKAVGAWSATSVSRTKDFGDFSEAELERARRLLERLPWTLGWRRTRRWKSANSGAPHLRLLVRRNLTRGGDLVELPRRRRREAPRPIVVLGDVSGSMARYSRMLLHLVYGLSHSQVRVEAFLFATQLTRVTRATAAITRIARDVHDWGGGTRIGEALRTFNTTWARRVVRHGPVVLILSDGWDRGDPALLEREMARLSRNVRRVVWLNPLLGSATYEPLTRGMQAALKHVDDFLPAHNLESLEALVRVLGDRRQETGDRRQNKRDGTQDKGGGGGVTKMELRAEYRFDAGVVRVWDLLMDTTAIAGCIPGCRGLKPLGENRYETELGVAIAAVSGNFKGTVALEDLDPPRSYRMIVEGSGRPGFVKGNAQVALLPDGESTRVTIAARADVGGTIARVGQRLLEGVAKTMTDRFFTCLGKQL